MQNPLLSVDIILGKESVQKRCATRSRVRQGVPETSTEGSGGGNWLDRWNGRLRSYPRATVAALALVTVAVYAGSLRGTFVYDDEQQVLQNPFVLNPHLWRRIFTSSVWAFQGIGAWGNFYRPLQVFVYWLLYRVAGPDPAVFHLFQLLLYSATVWLVYRIGRELLRSETVAFAGAALWALHPLHVEAVAWIAGLPEVGFGLFYLLGFLLFLRAERTPGRSARLHALAALAWWPALFFKEMAISLPLLLLVYWFFHPASDGWLKRLARLAPYGAALGVYAAIRLHVMGHLTHLFRPGTLSLPVLGASVGLLGEHTKIFFWPLHLSAFRAFDLGSSLRSPWPWLTLLGLVAALWMGRREPRLGFLVFWWPVTLLPCLDIRQLSVPLLADRFSYIPSVGLCLALAFAGLVLAPAQIPSANAMRLGATSLAGVLLFWAIRSYLAVPVWRDGQTLMRHSLQQSPEAAPLHIVQGWILEYEKGDLDASEREFRMALELNDASLRPLSLVTYNATIGLGQIAYRRGQAGVALKHFEDAVRLLPNHAEAYKVLGSVYFPRGDYTQAAEYFSRAVRVNPMDPVARFMLGTCRMKQGRYREAAEQFRAATGLDPGYQQAYQAEVRALEAAGEADEATRVRRLERPDQ